MKGIFRNIMGLLSIGTAAGIGQVGTADRTAAAGITSGGLIEMGYLYRTPGSYRRQRKTARKMANKRLHPKSL